MTPQNTDTTTGWTRERYYFMMAVLLFVGLSWIMATRAPAHQRPTTAAPRPGFLAPDFELPLLDGGTAKLSDYRGHHVVLNFWATWCPPCRAEMPAIIKEYTRYKDKGLIVLAIDQSEPEEKVRAFRDAYGMPFPILLDKSMRVADMYRIRSLPTTYFITPDGTIIDKVEGMMTKAMVRARFQHLMESR